MPICNCSHDEIVKANAIYDSNRSRFLKTKQILEERPKLRLQNSKRPPEIWTYRAKEREAKRLKEQLNALARELGIDS